MKVHVNIWSNCRFNQWLFECQCTRHKASFPWYACTCIYSLPCNKKSPAGATRKIYIACCLFLLVKGINLVQFSQHLVGSALRSNAGHVALLRVSVYICIEKKDFPQLSCKLPQSSADFILGLSLALHLFLFFSSVSDRNLHIFSNYP